MAILFIRTLILYTLVIMALRIMGKRQIGELQPSELVVAIMISDLASVPMSEVSVPLLYGIIPIFTLVISEIVLSFLCLKFQKFRIVLSGRPQILVKNGKLCFKEMKRARVNTDDLLEELRKNGCYSLYDVDTVILETGGSVTVIPTADAMPPTLGDINVNISQPQIPYVYIADGKVRKSELKRAGKNEKWINKTLKENNIDSIKQVFILMEDSNKKLYIQKRKESK